MRSDLYIKVVLTVIAAMLAVLDWRSVFHAESVHPESRARAEGFVAGIQHMTGNMAVNGLTMLDTQTGDVWTLFGSQVGYGGTVDPPRWFYEGRVGGFGKPVTGWEEQWKTRCPGCKVPAATEAQNER